MPGPYTPTGPFVNGTSPGLSAALFNNLEAYIAWAEGDASAQVTVTGTTAGTATLYQFLQGGLKGFFLYYNGYRNSTGTEQFLALPVGFTAYGVWLSGGIPQAHMDVGSTQVNNGIKVVTTLASSSSAGLTTTQSFFQGYATGEFIGAFDHIGLGVSMGFNFTAGMFLIGV